MSAFKLEAGDPDFKDRQKKVFDQLMVLENSRNSTPTKERDPRDEPRSDRRSQKKETKHFRGKESIFKRPQNPAPKNYINKIPDFKKNPHKWTKYSLEDVQDITDESNTKSAMDFLRELANRKQRENGMEEEKLEELPSKIVFNKHLRTNTIRDKTTAIDGDINESEQKPTFSHSSSKIVMPEYVIGQKPPKKDKPKRSSKADKGKELKLDHLMFEDD
ncbi:unnamed protein product [Ceutorhynchus assimilis]|uniref:U5 small nuclear ribonucleoprotein TSSC4 n=1 Tax=Ceutorhynchus assimilis TaxID=467358 RepID=A0A9P0GSS0_9CUCU|nr:unnamed protein product [Ceutorhynchus assimilis]